MYDVETKTAQLKAIENAIKTDEEFYSKSIQEYVTETADMEKACIEK
jgi:hypothetical protein